MNGCEMSERQRQRSTGGSERGAGLAPVCALLDVISQRVCLPRLQTLRFSRKLDPLVVFSLLSSLFGLKWHAIPHRAPVYLDILFSRGPKRKHLIGRLVDPFSRG